MMIPSLLLLVGTLQSPTTYALSQMNPFDLGLRMAAHNALFLFPMDMDCEKDSLYILDFRLGHIIKVDTRTGELIRTFSSRGQGPKELILATSIRVRNGILYVGDKGYHGVKLFSSDSGAFLYSIKIEGNVDDIDVDSQGNILVKDVIPNENRLISLYNTKGEFVRVAARWEGRLGSASGDSYFKNTFMRFRLDAQDNLIVLFPMLRRITKFDNDGKIVWQRNLQNKVLSNAATRPDGVNRNDESITFHFNVFNIAVDGQNRILAGHNGGGQLIGADGEDLLLFEGHNLQIFGFNDGKLICVLPNGSVRIYRIPHEGGEP